MTSFLLTLSLVRHLRNVTAVATQHPILAASVFCLETPQANQNSENIEFRGLELVCGMGGGQSTNTAADVGQKNQDSPSPQGNKQSTSQTADTENGTQPPESGTDLPQCRMCSKTVDDMSFMISCTNWY